MQIGPRPMPDADPTEALFREALTELRDVKKMLLGNGSVGMFEQVRDNASDIAAIRDELKRVWAAFDKIHRKDRSNVAMVEQAIRQTLPSGDARERTKQEKLKVAAGVLTMLTSLAALVLTIVNMLGAP